MKKPVFLFILILVLCQNIKSQIWSTVGSPFNYHVYNFKVDQSNGYLYFASDDNNVYKYNGTNWSALGSGFDAPVYCMEFFNNELYACGGFTMVDGNSITGIAKWNGTTWVSVGGSITAPAGAAAVQLKTYNNKLYIAGYFTQFGGSVSANEIASWDGNTWSSVGTSPPSGPILGMGVFNNKLILGGAFTSIGGITTTGIASWNGTNYAALGSGLSGTLVNVVSMDTLNNELYIGGKLNAYNNIAKWNGTSWSQVGNGLGPSFVYEVINFNNQIIAGGSFTSSGSVTLNNLAKLNGNSWITFGNGANSSVYCLAKYNSTLYAGGYFTQIDNNNINFLAKYSNIAATFQTHEKLDKNYSIYPNPTQNKSFKIEFDSDGVKLLLIYDVIGNLVFNQEVNSFDSIQLDVEPGIYFLYIDGKTNKLIIK